MFERILAISLLVLLIIGCVGVVLGSGLLAWPFARLLRPIRVRYTPS